MAMKRAKIKSIPYEEFKDNETYEKLVEELNAGGANIIVRKLDDLIDWGRSNSLWPLTFATSCCGIEFMAVCAARYDIARFGFEVTRNSPRQADVILVCGTITTKMAPVLRRLYDQMADPEVCCSHWRLLNFGRSVYKVIPRAQWCGQDYSS